MLLAGSLRARGRPVVDHVEYAGSSRRLEQLAGTIGDDDLVIAESRDAGSDVHVLALPLAYIYARNVLVLLSGAPRQADVRCVPRMGAHALSPRAVHRRRRHRSAVAPVRRATRSRANASRSRSTTSPLECVSAIRAPEGIRLRRVRVHATGTSRDEARFDLDVGISDDLNVVRFHAKEISEGHTFRWTGPRRTFPSTMIHAVEPRVTLWMSDGGRPPAAAPADVSVFLQGQLLGTAPVGADSSPTRSPFRRISRPRGRDRRSGRAEAGDADLESAAACSARPTIATSASWSIAWR